MSYPRSGIRWAAAALLFLSSISSVFAGHTDRYLYDLDPYDINPKSWASWRKSLSPQEWQKWSDDLNLARWRWWRDSLSPDNWQRWKETMGPEDKALWLECNELGAQISAKEEKDPSAIHFKDTVLQMKVQ